MHRVEPNLYCQLYRGISHYLPLRLNYLTSCRLRSLLFALSTARNTRRLVQILCKVQATSSPLNQIPEFIEFEDRLDNSLQRDIAKMEHVRMRIVHDTINSELTDMELIELKFIFDRRAFKQLLVVPHVLTGLG